MKQASNTGSAKQIAKERVIVLFNQAKEVHAENPKLAVQYVGLARKIGMAARVRLPLELKRQVCKNCDALLVDANSCRVRLQQRREPHVVVTCLSCGYKSRILLRKKRKRAKIE